MKKLKREKRDKTSSCCYNKSSFCDFTGIQVWGAPGTSIYDDWVDCTYGTPKRLSVGASAYLPNLVKERGYTYAALQCNYNKQDPFGARTAYNPGSKP